MTYLRPSPSLARRKIASAAVLAVSLLSTHVFAQTTVEVSGTIDVYAGSMKRSGEGGRTSAVDSSGLETSWWGFNGTEDLGGGLRAHFSLSGFFRPDTGSLGRGDTDAMFSRSANVGLSGAFGRISFGRDLAPNFIPTLRFSPFGGSFAFSPLELHTQTSSGRYRSQAWSPTVSGDTGWSNAVMYVTPELGGFTTSVFVQLGEQAGQSGKNNYGINTMYESGPLSFGAYVQSVRVNNPTDAVSSGPSEVFSFTPYSRVTGTGYTLSASKNDTLFLGAAYDLQFIKLFGSVSRSQSSLARATDDRQFDLGSNTLQLGVSAPAGRGLFLFSWATTNVKAEGDFSSVLADPDIRSSITRHTASLGYDYFLSKRTDVYAVLSHDRITEQSSGTSVALGIRQRF